MSVSPQQWQCFVPPRALLVLATAQSFPAGSAAVSENGSPQNRVGIKPFLKFLKAK